METGRSMEWRASEEPRVRDSNGEMHQAEMTAQGVFLSLIAAEGQPEAGAS